MSCVWNRDENKAVPLVWEHCDIETPFEKESCIIFCFQSGYMFASNRVGILFQVVFTQVLFFLNKHL